MTAPTYAVFDFHLIITSFVYHAESKKLKNFGMKNELKKMELLMNIKGIKSQKKDKIILMGSKNRRRIQNFSATQYFYIAYSSAKKSQPLFCFI
jgi:hypothetical protein